MIKRPDYPPVDTQIVMRAVLIALVPGIIAMTLFFGVGVLFNLATAIPAALAAEAVSGLRQRPILPRPTIYLPFSPVPLSHSHCHRRLRGG